MSLSFELNASVREAHGKANSRRLRREQEMVPAVVYGAGKNPQSLTLKHSDVIKVLENEAVFSHILTLNIEGRKTPEKVILKDLQRHVYKPKIMHMDFLRVKANEKLTTKVPVHFIGGDKAPGVVAGGIINHTLTELEISCLPANLPEFIEADISSLELGDSVHLSNLTLPKGVELTAMSHGDDSTDAVVASIQAPKAQAEPAEEEAPAAEDEASTDYSAPEGE